MSNKTRKTAQSLYLDTIKASDLDDFLSRGWYRMGPTIFCSFFIFFERSLFSTIWLRTPLENYKLSKSLKKLDRKNKARLTHSFEPFEYSDTVEELYQKYRLTFKGNLPEYLDSYMMDSLDMDIYDTYLVKVYAEDSLIACSIFDVGDNSLASIFGFYNPAYSSMSLGLYTMLLEIEFAKQEQMSFYYIGYFVPGNPRFDYKLRLGNIEYLDFKTSQWLSLEIFDFEQTPIKLIRRKLDSLKSKLNQKKYDTIIYQNAFIDVNIIEFFPLRYVEDPLIMFLQGYSSTQSLSEIIICIYDVRIGSYKLYQCQILDSSFSRYNQDWVDSLDDGTFKYRLIIKKTLKTCKTIAPIERWMQQFHAK